ncbi:MAG: hypothetical protein COA73_08520 [Candidatus Hydrogenedentota bacterium]|nr:MAG: hypothetical protein COA73_08520 [Candidatus Hydrogenedentota bacterium]
MSELAPPEIKESRTLRQHFREGFRKANKRRPASFYLLLAMVAVLPFGGQIYLIQDDPHRFALVLMLFFVFFFVVISRAIVDCFDIMRSHFRERETLMKIVFTRDDFAVDLGKRISQSQQDWT